MESFTKEAMLFKALSDPKRLTILSILKHGEKCACVLMEEMQIAQSALSYHMKILCESGIVNGRQDGKWIHYRMNQKGCDEVGECLKEMTTCTPIPPTHCCQ